MYLYTVVPYIGITNQMASATQLVRTTAPKSQATELRADSFATAPQLG